jgi:hypothetical protein
MPRIFPTRSPRRRRQFWAPEAPATDSYQHSKWQKEFTGGMVPISSLCHGERAGKVHFMHAGCRAQRPETSYKDISPGFIKSWPVSRKTGLESLICVVAVIDGRQPGSV